MPEKTVKTPSDSRTFIAEIVGDESLIGQRMSAGKLLHMMDIAAANAAARHAAGPLVTLAFDRIELLDPICHRDYVRFDACVIEVGRSSMVVKVDGSYKPPGEPDPVPGHSHIITMVAINEERRPNRNIPGMVYRSDRDRKLRDLARSRRRLLERRRRSEEAVAAMVSDGKPKLIDHYPRTTHTHPDTGGLVIRRRFLPRNVNALGNVFGGDTVEMMEELALATARQHTGNHRMVTIAMEDVFFLRPLELQHLVEMQAHVVFVANTTLVVKITVRAVPLYEENEGYVTNSGLFTVLNFDRSGRKKSIARGLELEGTDTAFRRRYLTELMKYEKRTGRPPSCQA